MFSKTAEPAATPRPMMPASTIGSARSLLSADLTITGEITSTGIVEVMGEIDGIISARGLVVGIDGRVKGTISADSVEVKGRLDGSVTTNSFTLRAAATVRADVTYAALVIESGAQIEGRFSLKKD